jgi:hypothetical protein
MSVGAIATPAKMAAGAMSATLGTKTSGTVPPQSTITDATKRLSSGHRQPRVPYPRPALYVPCLRNESQVHRPFGIHAYYERQRRCRNRRCRRRGRSRQQPLAPLPFSRSMEFQNIRGGASAVTPVDAAVLQRRCPRRAPFPPGALHLRSYASPLDDLLRCTRGSWPCIPSTYLRGREPQRAPSATLQAAGAQVGPGERGAPRDEAHRETTDT